MGHRDATKKVSYKSQITTFFIALYTLKYQNKF